MCGNNKVAMQVFGPHSMNEDGTVIPFGEQMAIVSHFLHNQGYKYAKPYEKKAERLIEDIYNFHQRPAETDCLSDANTVQYSLFSDLFSVPFLPIDNPKMTLKTTYSSIHALRHQALRDIFSERYIKKMASTF